MHDYGKEMAELVERNIQKAIMVGPPEEFCIPVDDLRGSSFYYLFNEDLFLEILGNRPEVAHADIDGNEILLTIAPEYLRQRKQAMRTISVEDFSGTQIISAVLFTNDLLIIAIGIISPLKKYRTNNESFLSVHKGLLLRFSPTLSRGCAIFLTTPRFLG